MSRRRCGQFVIGEFSGIKDFGSSLGLSIGLFCLLSLPTHSIDINKLPVVEEVQAGNINFSQSNNSLTVNSLSSKGIINYQSFDVGKNATVNFNLPSSDAAILNRVTTNNPSQIYGSINSNGHVFLVNPSGILFGSSAQVNVGGLTASTLGLNNKDFLEGNYVFKNNTNAGIRNEGNLRSLDKGSINLISSAIENTGKIEAPNGQVNLLVGDSVQLHLDGNISMNVEITESLQEKVNNFENAILNSGEITANSGIVRLQAELKEALCSNIINNEGIIKAEGLTENNGVIELISKTGTQDGLIKNRGRISATNELGNGGDVLIQGDSVLLTADSQIDVSAKNKGGLIDLKTRKAKSGGGGNFQCSVL
ncbi:MAG: filamentous hemagglutinin N-terminal domain-containing protein [Candidatus Caenarcaniphilales bacterium]|nr:filamentous hemagglutinin N-terminal domain-containing protein [Candidatus Caenarcaniphilales bacterium]